MCYSDRANQLRSPSPHTLILVSGAMFSWITRPDLSVHPSAHELLLVSCSFFSSPSSPFPHLSTTPISYLSSCSTFTRFGLYRHLVPMGV